jgi:hypothetical protein
MLFKIIGVAHGRQQGCSDVTKHVMIHMLAVAMRFAGLLTRQRERYIYTAICTDCSH